jgi:hypothetical protein
MRVRRWLAGVLMVALGATVQPAPARAAFWPFSLFSAKKTPAKKTKGKSGKPGKPNYATHVKQIKTGG